MKTFSAMSQAVRWPDAAAGPWLVTCHFAIVDERYECVGVDVRSFDVRQRSDPNARGRATCEPEYREISGGLGRRAISSTNWRQLPIAALIQEAREQLAELARVWPVSAPESMLTPAGRDALRESSDALEQPAYRLYSDEHYQHVAEVYREAWGAGHPPTRAVAEQLKAPSRTAAAKWVARARELGYLGPTEQRHAGVGSLVRRRATKKEG